MSQQIGRGMRLSPSTGKEDCHILDFVDAQGRVAGAFSTPTLFGLDPTEMIPGMAYDTDLIIFNDNALQGRHWMNY